MSETKSKTKMLADKGMNVSKPSAQLKADLQAVGATMSQEWAKEAGSAGQDILNGMK
jgi:TRAP-type C4-dicarboxylate transport system substrate-binding protein